MYREFEYLQVSAPQGDDFRRNDLSLCGFKRSIGEVADFSDMTSVFVSGGEIREGFPYCLDAEPVKKLCSIGSYAFYVLDVDS
jgi:hypothetical protein